MSMDREASPKSLQELFDRCWSDAEVMDRFLAEPAAMLNEHGFMDIRGMDVEIVENKQDKIHLIFHCESPDKIHLVSQRHPRSIDFTS